MSADQNTIRELLEQLIDLSLEERHQRLEEIKKDSPELHDELESLLPFADGDQQDVVDVDPFIGEVIDQFTIEKKIGSGGMGRVYLAQQAKPQRAVAIKILRRGLLSKSATKRFEIECMLLGRLHHGGIAQIYQAGTHDLHGDNVPWIAMEYIENAAPLTSYVKDKALTTDETLALFTSVCEAVSEAHRQGIIHRDLKPANILLNAQGSPKIIDFGVAKAIDPMGMPTALVTHSADLIGTMQYMSPEQASGDAVAITSDVYSLGVLLYEMLSGERPYELHSTTIPGAIETITKAEPRPLQLSSKSSNKSMNRNLDTVIKKAMAHDPRKRYRSANDVSDDIQRVLDGEPISARKESFLAKFLRKRRRTAAAIVFALPILAIATATSVFFAFQAQHELDQKNKLIEFAKDALATRDEIIVTNPEYWKTHIDTIVHNAKKTAGESVSLLAEMYKLLFSTAKSARIINDLRTHTAELVGINSNEGILLQIEQAAYNNTNRPIKERINTIKDLQKSFTNPTLVTALKSITALSFVQLHSEDPKMYADGLANSAEAEQIIKEYFDSDIRTLSPIIARRSWAFTFHDKNPDSSIKVLALLGEDLVNEYIIEFGEHHPNTLRIMVHRAIALERLMRLEEACRLHKEVARITVEKYGVSHNMAWRRLNNLAICLVKIANQQNTPTDKSQELKLQAASLWSECVRQAAIHGINGDVSWYSNNFLELLPNLAPTPETLANWQQIVKNGPLPNLADRQPHVSPNISPNFSLNSPDSSTPDFRSVLVDTHIE